IRKHKKIITLVGIALLGILLIVSVVFGIKHWSKDKKDENPSTSVTPNTTTTPEKTQENEKPKEGNNTDEQGVKDKDAKESPQESGTEKGTGKEGTANSSEPVSVGVSEIRKETDSGQSNKITKNPLNTAINQTDLGTLNTKPANLEAIKELVLSKNTGLDKDAKNYELVNVIGETETKIKATSDNATYEGEVKLTYVNMERIAKETDEKHNQIDFDLTAITENDKNDLNNSRDQVLSRGENNATLKESATLEQVQTYKNKVETILNNQKEAKKPFIKYILKNQSKVDNMDVTEGTNIIKSESDDEGFKKAKLHSYRLKNLQKLKTNIENKIMRNATLEKRIRNKEQQVMWGLENSYKNYDSTYDSKGNEVSRICYKQEGVPEYSYSWVATYDDNENLTEKRSINNKKTDNNYEYNWDNFRTWNATYDSNGNKIQNRKLKKPKEDGTLQVDWESVYTWDADYDDDGNRTEVRKFKVSTDPNVEQEVDWSKSIKRLYDDKGNIIQNRQLKVSATDGSYEVNWSSDQTWDAEYDVNGNQIKRRGFKNKSDGTREINLSNSWDAKYDQNGNKTQNRKLKSLNSDGSVEVDWNSFDTWDEAFDPAGNKIKHLEYKLQNGEPVIDWSKSQTLEYNALRKITKSYRYRNENEKDWTHDDTYTSSWDERGNQLQNLKYLASGEVDWAHDETGSAQYNSKNLPIKIFKYKATGEIDWTHEGTCDIEYDEQGNLLRYIRYDEKGNKIIVKNPLNTVIKTTDLGTLKTKPSDLEEIKELVLSKNTGLDEEGTNYELVNTIGETETKIKATSDNAKYEGEVKLTYVSLENIMKTANDMYQNIDLTTISETEKYDLNNARDAVVLNEKSLLKLKESATLEQVQTYKNKVETILNKQQGNKIYIQYILKNRLKVSNMNVTEGTKLTKNDLHQLAKLNKASLEDLSKVKTNIENKIVRNQTKEFRARDGNNNIIWGQNKVHDNVDSTYDDNGNEIRHISYKQQGVIYPYFSWTAIYDENGNKKESRGLNADGNVDYSSWNSWNGKYDQNGNQTEKRALKGITSLSEGSTLIINWNSTNTWDAAYDNNGYQTIKRAYKTGADDSEGVIRWDSPNTWTGVSDNNGNRIQMRYYKDNQEVNWVKSYDAQYDRYNNQTQSRHFYNELDEQNQPKINWGESWDAKYNDNREEIECRRYKKDGTINWGHKSTYNADFENGKKVKLLKYKDGGVIDWTNENTFTAKFDSNGNQTEHLKYTAENVVDWGNPYTWKAEYDDQHRETKVLKFKNDGEVNWDHQDTFTAEYDTNGNMTKRRKYKQQYSHKDDKDAIDWIYQGTYDAKYNNNNMQTRGRRYQENGEIDWTNEGTFDAEYDQNNCQTKYLRYKEGPEENPKVDWLHEQTFTAKYDAQKNQIELLVYKDDGTVDWTHEETYSTRYDGDGNPYKIVFDENGTPRRV
ncbi:hypothetical protein HR065_00105, partial [Candidatus Phytoplasma pruni]|nr:hypothetical protein [Candidatus Phytoplasma pruni]